MQLSSEQLQHYTLVEIENILQKVGKTLKDIDGMPVQDFSLVRDVGNRLVAEELDYDIDEMKALHEELYTYLNQCQKVPFEAIIDSVVNERGQLFFISGHGGTGKTFLWKKIITKLRSEGNIVLLVASSGITTLLLPNGRTAHSRFHIPLEIIAESSCEIRHGTHLTELLCKTSLIIWDEAHMANKYCFETLDRSLRDIFQMRYENSFDKPFGGLTVVLGGDFRQILSVLPKGGKTDIIEASLNSSYLWEHCNVFKLNQNMRLSTGSLGSQAEDLSLFDRWLLQIGDGSFYDNPDKELIRIPTNALLHHDGDPIKYIVQAVYPSLSKLFHDSFYLKEHAILTPKNETVHQLNQFVMDLIPGEKVTYLSSDTICRTSTAGNDDELLYTTEFLNKLHFSGVSNHDVQLKVVVPVMLLRNLNQAEGLCNGTRLIVKHLEKWSVTLQLFPELT